MDELNNYFICVVIAMNHCDFSKNCIRKYYEIILNITKSSICFNFITITIIVITITFVTK